MLQGRVQIASGNLAGGSFVWKDRESGEGATFGIGPYWIGHLCPDCNALLIEREEGEPIIPEDDTSEESDCLACGETIPAGTSACPSCGWSYADAD